MPRPQGWVPDPEATDKFVASLKHPTLASAGPSLADDGKDAVLYPAILQVCPTYTRVAQAIGSCVGHGFAGCVDALSSTEIVVHGEAEDWKGRCLEASVYAFSRVEIRGRPNYGGDGSYGAAAAAAVTKYGTLHYDVDYGGEKFTAYSGEREKSWGATGVPDKLEPYAAQRLVKSCTKVESFEELCRALSSGYPTAVCSNQGFTLSRDSMGFAKPRSQWSHCMALIGKRGGKRPGALCWNSWGPKAHSGPHYSGIEGMTMPPAFVGCTFWIDADVVDRMLSLGDSFALSSYDGFPPRKLPDWSGNIL
jgi:hypothetical protein